jgi:hypothetical protein
VADQQSTLERNIVISVVCFDTISLKIDGMT